VKQAHAAHEQPVDTIMVVEVPWTGLSSDEDMPRHTAHCEQLGERVVE